MARIQIRHRFLFVLSLIALLAGACDQLPLNGPALQSTSVLVQTIPPATLTAISAAAEPSQTPVPQPMGMPWSSVQGIELDFWYVWDLDQPGTGMNAIVDRFNEENEWGIVVNPVDQGMVLDPLGSIETAFDEGLVPHVLLGDAGAAASWYLDGLTVDLAPYFEDPAAGLTAEDIKDYYPGVIEGFSIGNSVRPGLPFSQSIQAIYYNQSWAEELGFSSPPESGEDLKKQACFAGANPGLSERSDFRGTGILISPEAVNIASGIFAYGGYLLNADQDGYQFTAPQVRQLAEDWTNLIEEDCGLSDYRYPDPLASEIAFEHFNQRQTLMMMGSAQMMNQVMTGPNRTGRADEWILLPFFGPESNKAVAAEIQSAVIFQTSAEEELASWLFLTYLNSPEVQAEWARYSRLYPTRKGSLRFLRDFRNENPHWSQGLNLLKYGVGLPLDPSWNTVKLSVGDAFEEIFADPSLDVEDQLLALDRMAAELWEYYREGK